MKILFVTHNYFPIIGGAEMIAQEIAERLAEKDEVAVFTSNAPSAEAYMNPAIPLLPPVSEVVRGVSVRRFNVWRRWMPRYGKYADLFWTRKYPFHDIARMLYNGPHMPGMLAALMVEKADVLIAIPFPFLNVYYSYIAHKIRAVPLIIIPCMHVEDARNFDLDIMYRVMRGADLILPNTPHVKENLVAHGVKADRIIPVGAGIDPAFFEPVSGTDVRQKYGIGDTHVVLFAGRKIQPKGIEMLLQAMDTVWEEIPRAQLVVAGSSTPYWNELWRRLPRGTRDRTISIDDFPEEEKRAIFDACDVFAMPSLVDSFGITFLEAWARSKPVVGLRAGGVPGLVKDGVDGLLMEKGDVAGLAGAIISLLLDRERAERMGREGRQKALCCHTWDIAAEKVRSACRAVTAARFSHQR